MPEVYRVKHYRGERAKIGRRGKTAQSSKTLHSQHSKNPDVIMLKVLKISNDFENPDHFPVI